MWAKPAKFLTPAGQKPVEWVSTALFAVALAMTFVARWRREHTLSIHAITTHRREGFYWAVIVVLVINLTVHKPDRVATADGAPSPDRHITATWTSRGRRMVA